MWPPSQCPEWGQLRKKKKEKKKDQVKGHQIEK
jgi:hypothetical protein